MVIGNISGFLDLVAYKYSYKTVTIHYPVVLLVALAMKEVDALAQFFSIFPHNKEHIQEDLP